MSNQFYRDRARRLHAITMDLRLSHLAVRVAYVLANYINGDRGVAWPTKGRLASDLGVSRWTIGRAIDELVDTGHFVVDRSSGRHSNRYRFAGDDANTNRSKSATVEQPNRSKSAHPTVAHGATSNNLTTNPHYKSAAGKKEGSRAEVVSEPRQTSSLKPFGSFEWRDTDEDRAFGGRLGLNASRQAYQRQQFWAHADKVRREFCDLADISRAYQKWLVNAAGRYRADGEQLRPLPPALVARHLEAMA
jgi:Helix-turn-helix domain